MKIKSSLIGVLAATMVFASCSKHAGSGGTSSIRGKLTGLHTSNGKDPSNEVTTVIFTPGAVIDDNDYWLINSASGNQYYIWYDNTNWIGGDPALIGRIGIKVTFDFYEDNATIATNTLTALNTLASSDFNFSLSNDVLTITDKTSGVNVDADNMNTPFSVDVASQGSSGTAGTTYSGPMVDQRVYLIYDDDSFYSDDVRTNENGEYEFKGLRKGHYVIYAISKDSNDPNALIQVQTEADITKNKSIVEVDDLYIID